MQRLWASGSVSRASVARRGRMALTATGRLWARHVRPTRDVVLRGAALGGLLCVGLAAVTGLRGIERAAIAVVSVLTPERRAADVGSSSGKARSGETTAEARVDLTGDDWNDMIRKPEFWARRGGGPRPGGASSAPKPFVNPDAGAQRAALGVWPPAVTEPPPPQSRTKPSVKDDDDNDGDTVRTVCVRLCDGAYFPISFATSRDRLETDAKTCKASCGMEARLFFYANPGGEIADMEDQDGKPYQKLPTAFLFKTKYDAACKCRPHPWEEASLDRHKLYALETQRARGDTAVAAQLDAVRSRLRVTEEDKSAGKIRAAEQRVAEARRKADEAKLVAVAKQSAFSAARADVQSATDKDATARAKSAAAKAKTEADRAGKAEKAALEAVADAADDLKSIKTAEAKRVAEVTADLERRARESAETDAKRLAAVTAQAERDAREQAAREAKLAAAAVAKAEREARQAAERTARLERAAREKAERIARLEAEKLAREERLAKAREVRIAKEKADMEAKLARVAAEHEARDARLRSVNPAASPDVVTGRGRNGTAVPDLPQSTPKLTPDAGSAVVPPSGPGRAPGSPVPPVGPMQRSSALPAAEIMTSGLAGSRPAVVRLVNAPQMR